MNFLTTNYPNYIVKEELEISETMMQGQVLDAVLHEATVDDQMTSGSGTKNNLSQHNEEKTRKVADSYPCPKCQMPFGNRKLAQSHVRKIHSEIQKRLETCPICSTTCKYKSVLSVHMNNHREKVCAICNLVVSDTEALKNHVESLHIGKLDFVCPICFKLSVDTSSHDDHVSSHNGRRRYECADCSKCYASLEGLERHRQAHDRIIKNKYRVQYKCSMCSKAYASGRNLRVHMNTHKVTRPLNCDQCPENFFSREALQRHRKTHSSLPRKIMQRKFKCLYCLKSYCSRQDLRSHLNTHTGKRPFKCDECPKDYASAQALENHRKTHIDVPSKIKLGIYKCSYCLNTYTNKYNLRIHINTHTGAQPFKCDQCPKSFVSPWALTRHRPKHIPGASPLKCSICSKTLSNSQSLRFHMNIHTDTRPYQCKQCLKSFANPWALAHHRPRHLLGGRQLKCSTCAKTFCNSQKLRYHMNIHTGARPYKCDQCPKSFASPGGLSQHRQRHLPGGKCSICSKPLSDLQQLRVHMSEHAGTHPYKCDQCSERYASPQTLQNHHNTHIHLPKKVKERKYKCTYCLKSYTNNNNLRYHINTHTGTRPFKCDQCPKSFTGSGSLTKHRQIHLQKDKSGCSEVFTEQRSLNLHMNSHYHASFKCHQCEKAYTSRKGLAQHHRANPTHGNYEYKCSICLKGFYVKNNLNSHMKTHLEAPLYKCDQCSKYYATLRGLNVHLKKYLIKPEESKVERPGKSLYDEGKGGEVDTILDLHTALAKYKCKECSKEFISERNLRFHLRLHQKEPMS